jgi:hypothetical protein
LFFPLLQQQFPSPFCFEHRKRDGDVASTIDGVFFP